MSANKFFPRRPDSRPTIYAYEDSNPQYAALLKVGYTTVDAQSRVAQQYPTMRPGKLPYRIVLEEAAMRNDGTVHVRGTNFCKLIVDLDERTNRIRIVSHIDNLLKGQAGSALQNMNLICGLAENEGLCQAPKYP